MGLETILRALYYAAWKNDQGITDPRIEGSSLKVMAAEMLSKIQRWTSARALFSRENQIIPLWLPRMETKR